MKNYVILADMTCDLSEEIRKDYGIDDYIVGHVYLSDGKEEKEIPGTLDWNHVSREEFYAVLSDRKMKVTTSPANSEEYFRRFEEYAKQGVSVISISLSSKISSTYEFACQGAKRVRELYPEAEIVCVDSYRMSGAFGLLVLCAQQMKNDGYSMEEVVNWLEENKYCVHQMGPIDDLFFVARRGRTTMGKAIFGSFAGVKPMGDCNSDGYTTVLTKVKGIGKALDVTVQYVKDTAVDLSEQTVLIAHSDREMYAKSLKEKIEADLSPKKVYLTDVFSGSGANVGPGMVGVYYLGNKISEDLSAEKDVMAHIVGK